MSRVCHFSVVTPRQASGNFHRNDYLMLHHFAGSTIQVANLVNYNFQEDGNKKRQICYRYKITDTDFDLMC